MQIDTYPTSFKIVDRVDDAIAIAKEGKICCLDTSLTLNNLFNIYDCLAAYGVMSESYDLHSKYIQNVYVVIDSLERIDTINEINLAYKIAGVCIPRNLSDDVGKTIATACKRNYPQANIIISPLPQQ